MKKYLYYVTHESIIIRQKTTLQQKTKQAIGYTEKNEINKIFKPLMAAQISFFYCSLGTFNVIGTLHNYIGKDDPHY